MTIARILLLGLLLLSSAPTQPLLFSQASVYFKTAAIIPRGTLKNVLDPAPAAGIYLTTPYYGRFKAHAQMMYSLLDGAQSPVSVHYIKSGAALSYTPPLPYLPGFGAGLGHYYTRAHNVYTPRPSGYLLRDNESEFGWYPFILWELSIAKKLRAAAGAEWDIVWSQSHYSHLPVIFIAMGWSWP